VTRRQALAKVAASGGTLYPRRDARSPGGWYARSIITNKAANARYARSAKGRARHARKNLGNCRGRIRLNRRGERFRESDLLALRAEQRGLCWVCGKPLRGKLRDGRKAEVVEHCHRTGFVRTLAHSHCNTLLAVIEKLKIPVHELHAWIVRVQAALYMPFLLMTAAEIRQAKARSTR
jgi:Recombination endonuclease VII